MKPSRVLPVQPHSYSYRYDPYLPTRWSGDEVTSSITLDAPWK